jgi:hypothetical protein
MPGISMMITGTRPISPQFSTKLQDVAIPVIEVARTHLNIRFGRLSADAALAHAAGFIQCWPDSVTHHV